MSYHGSGSGLGASSALLSMIDTSQMDLLKVEAAKAISYERPILKKIDLNTPIQDFKLKNSDPPGFSVEPQMWAGGARCMQGYLKYDVPCNTKNVQKYMFQEQRYDEARDRLRWLYKHPPDLADAVQGGSSYTPKIVDATGDELYDGSGKMEKWLRQGRVSGAATDKGKEALNWILNVIEAANDLYDASNVPSQYCHAVTPWESFKPTGAKNAVIPWIRPPAVVMDDVSSDKKGTYLDSMPLRASDPVDWVRTIDYRTRKWPGFRRGEKRREERRCHKQYEFKFMSGGRGEKDKKVTFRQYAKYLALTGGVAGKLRGLRTIERSRSHPKGRCGKTDVYYVASGAVTIHAYKLWAKWLSETPMQDLLAAGMQEFINDLDYFIETYGENLSPENLRPIMEARRQAERKEIIGMISGASAIASIANAVMAVAAAVLSALLIGLVEIVGTAVGGMFCPRYPFRRVITREGCDPQTEKAIAEASKQMATAVVELGPTEVFISPEERRKREQERQRERQKQQPTFWDKYKWWIIGGGTFMAAATAVPLLAKNEGAPRRRRKRRTSKR